MAKIIATAGVRLRAESAGLAVSIRLVLQRAISEASKGLGDGSTEGIARDAERTSQRTKALFKGAFDSVRNLAGSLGSAILSGSRLLLMGAAAGTALTAVTGLSAGLIALVGAAAQAGAAIGILPAALVAIKAVTATVQLGLVGMSETFKAIASNDAAAFNEALKNLAPQARVFAQEIKAFKPAFDALRLDVQNALFENTGKAIQALGKQYLPVARGLFVELAHQINNTGLNLAEFLKSSRSMSTIAGVASSITTGFARMREAAVPFASALLDIVSAGSTQLPRLGTAIAGIAERFAAFIGGLRDSGRLQEIFSTSLDVASQLGRILGNLGQIIGQVFSAGQAQGAGLLASLELMTERAAEFLASFEGQEALQGFFSAIGALVSNVLPVIQQLALAIGGGLAPIIQNLAQSIGPGLVALFAQLNPALSAANPGISALGEAFGKVLIAIAPILPALGTLVGQLAGVFAQALTAILPALTSFITMITSSPGAFAGFAAAAGAIALVFSNLGPLFKSIAPFLDDMLTKVGGMRGAFAALGGPIGIAIALFLTLVTGSEEFRNAIGGLLSTVGTLIGSLLGALMPALDAIFSALSPVIAQLGAALAPVITLVADLLTAILTPAINALTPIVNALIPVFAQVAGVMSTVIAAIVPVISLIVGILTPIIQNLAPIVTTVFTVIADVITKAMRVVQGVIDLVMGVLTGDWDRAWRGIENIVRGALDLIKSVVLGSLQIVGSVISNTWNAVVSLTTSAWAGIKGAVSSGISGVIDFVSNLPGRIVSFFSNFGSLLYSAGADLLRGLMNGISSMVGQVIGRAKQIGGDILNGVKGALGISSPSKEMAKLGVFAGQGLVIGLDSMMGKIAEAAAEAGAALLTNTSTGLRTTLAFSGATATGSAVGGGTTVFQQTNIQQPGVDGKQFAEYASRNQAYALASAATLRSVSIGPLQQGMTSPDGFVGVRGVS